MNRSLVEEWLRKNCKSREWLADSIGVSARTLGRYLSGRRKAPLTSIRFTAQILGVSENELTRELEPEEVRTA